MATMTIAELIAMLESIREDIHGDIPVYFGGTCNFYEILEVELGLNHYEGNEELAVNILGE